MNYSFHPDAQAEFFAAIDYYETCKEGLGLEFSIEVHSTIERILCNPRAWPVLEGEIRRCQTARFPYGLLYAEHLNEVQILAVMHLHRHPDYWKQRLA